MTITNKPNTYKFIPSVFKYLYDSFGIPNIELIVTPIFYYILYTF